MKLGDVLNYTQPTKYIVSDEFYDDSYKTPVLTAGKTFLLGYTKEEGGIYLASKNPIILFDDFTTDIKWVDFDFKVKSSACKILTIKHGGDSDDLRYIYYAMHRISFDASQHMRYWISKYSQCEIKYPDKAKRSSIVKTLDLIHQIIGNEERFLKLLDELIKSRFIELFGSPDLSVQNPGWPIVTSFSTIVTGTTPATGDPENWDGDILWVTPAEIEKDAFYLFDTERKITEKGRKSKSLSLMPIGTVILSTRAPIGKVAIVGKEMTCNQGFKNFICKQNVNPIYLYFLLKYNNEYLNSIGSGTTFKEISKSKLEALRMPIPKKEIQDSFSAFVESIDKLKFSGIISV